MAGAGVRFGGESSYTVVAVVATARPRMAIDRFRDQVRAGRLVFFIAATAALVIGALHIPTWLPAGADLADPAQRLYAENLWAQVQVSLVFIGCFLPWLIYALLWKGAARGALILGGVAVAGTALATFVTVVTVGTYAALPSLVGGVVSRREGRIIQLAGAGKSYYLVLSDRQLVSSSPWLKRGVRVVMWVSPRSQVGAIEPDSTSVDAG